MTDYRFPLLRLPENTAVHVLKHMEIFEIFGFSLLSRKTQQLTSAIHFDAPEAIVDISDHIEVQIDLIYATYKFVFYEGPSLNLDINMTSPRHAKLGIAWDIDRNQGIYSQTGWTMKNWADHLLKIFNYQKIRALFLDEDGKYNAKSIHAVFREFMMYNISPSIPQFIEYTECFYNTPYVRILNRLFERPITSVDQIQKMLAQSFEFVSSDHPLTLNDLLVSNCEIMCVRSHLGMRCVNFLLKDWMRGSFPNLKHLHLYVYGENMDILMKGIKHEVNERTRIKTCEHNLYETRQFQVYGGMDIQRDDGRKATIVVQGGIFKMLVWH